MVKLMNKNIIPFSLCLILTIFACCTLVLLHSYDTHRIFSSVPSVSRNQETILKRKSCDIFDGLWVFDPSLPIYSSESCPTIEQKFNCKLNGKRNQNFAKYRWQPKECNLSRFDGNKALELLRGKRIAFVGDSLNRNMWESLICMLRQFLTNKSRAFEASGRREFKDEATSMFIFDEYNCTVEFYRAPFLVQQGEEEDSKGSKKEILQLDIIHNSSEMYKNADFLVFNSGHWWTHNITANGIYYYKEGDKLHPRLSAEEAFEKALTTWAQWIDGTIDINKTRVYFRSYSWSHSRCEKDIVPITKEHELSTYHTLARVPNLILPKMRTPVKLLNITRLSDYRKDAHPSIYFLSKEEQKKRGYIQDCSHWCLPGVPDIWNTILFFLIAEDFGGVV